MDNAIKHIYIKGLWGKYNINWENLNPDVNILIGINGSGKSTLLSIVEDFFKGIIANNLGLEEVCIKTNNKTYACAISYFEETCAARFNSNDFSYKVKKIKTFDNPIYLDNKDVYGKSQLLDELEKLIYIIGSEKTSFGNYRLKATNYPDRASEINENIKNLFSLINGLFQRTDKKIEIDPATNKLIFRQSNNSIIQLDDLSSGEKQLLLILFNVFLMEQQAYVLLMDEPEASLHIEWQQKLIDIIRELNPNCQLIIATHSPSIFGDGWGDKLVFMEDIMSKISE